MLERGRDWADTSARFRWRIPARYNIGADVVDRHADGQGRLALIAVGADGRVARYSFDQIRDRSNALANAFVGLGARRGDRVGILLGQSLETALAHVAAYKAGLVAVPLFTLFGPEALAFRLSDSGARILVTDADNAPKVTGVDHKLVVGTKAFRSLMEAGRSDFAPVDTAADDPALIIYTSGTTGQPKGALHSHRVLLGHLPGVEFPHDFPPRAGDCFWTPADWAWIGGLLDVLLPAWHHGLPVVAHRMAKFDPDRAFAVMRDHGVRNVFLPPTALKLMRQASSRVHSGLRSIGSGGETLGAELLDWGRATFGVNIHEFYGQTECNLVVANNAAQFPLQAGSMGRAAPGHEVAIIGPDGQQLPPGELGDIAVRRPDPVMFLGYWNQPEATAAKFRGDWLVTGDLGRQDGDANFWFTGRADDVITSAGYRIGPGEVEDCLMRHPAVALAAVIGVPDPIRTEIVKAFVVLKPGTAGSAALEAELQDFVRARLAAHEYPRQVAFVDSLPMTATGKIIRRALREED